MAIIEDVYYQQLDRLKENITSNVLCFVKQKIVILHHDNAWVDTEKQSQKKNKIVGMIGSCKSSIFTRFNTDRFSFVPISRIFHKWQNHLEIIEIENRFSHFFQRKTHIYLNAESKMCLPGTLKPSSKIKFVYIFLYIF